MQEKLPSEQFANELITLLKRVGPQGQIPPVNDLEEWEEKLKSLPPDQRDLARELARFVDLEISPRTGNRAWEGDHAISGSAS